MNLKKLYETNVLNIDAQTAAIDFKYDFKREVVDVINDHFAKVDIKKTFEKDDYRNSNLNLYNKYGNAERSENYWSDYKQIKIYLHKTYRRKDGDEEQDYITLSPDTMGNVSLRMNSVSVGHNGPSFKVPIASKTVKEFVQSIIPVLKKLSRYKKPAQENQSETSELESISGEIKALEIEGIKSVVSEIKLNNDYWSDSDRPPTRLLVIAIDATPEKELSNRIRNFYDFTHEMYNIIEKTASIKSAYKRATGKSAGKKGEEYGSLSHSIKILGSDIERRLSENSAYENVKAAVMAINKFLKKTSWKIVDISGKSSLGSEFIITIDIVPKNEFFKTARGFDEKEEFNVFEFIKNFPRYDIDKEIHDSLIHITEKLLPIAPQLVKQLFKEN